MGFGRGQGRERLRRAERGRANEVLNIGWDIQAGACSGVRQGRMRDSQPAGGIIESPHLSRMNLLELSGAKVDYLGDDAVWMYGEEFRERRANLVDRRIRG